MTRFSYLVVSLLALIFISVAHAKTNANSTIIDEKYIHDLKSRAEADDVNAQNELGILYAEGKVVPKDDLEAMTWFLIVDTNKKKNVQINTVLQAKRKSFVSLKGIHSAMSNAMKWRIAKAAGGGVDNSAEFTRSLNKSFLNVNEAELKERFLELQWGYDSSILKLDRHLTLCDTSMRYLTKFYGYILPFYKVMWCAEPNGKIFWIEGYVEEIKP
ncbi:MAG: SEL1-like repeat protein [bacterium]|nr:SEL1-like repeat protein [bacterium]